MQSDEKKPLAVETASAVAEQGSAELRSSTETAGGSAPRDTFGTVFISHKVRPDEPIAAAVQALLEGTIEPTPKVFVSGVGGIVPSEDTAWGQMQSAATGANAFVAVITKHSLNREWIFFEAGAAWGRHVMYAPLLVKVGPEELPNTLKAYQATAYDEEAKVRELVQEIASKLGSSLKPRAFPYKYKDFARALADHFGERRPSEEEGRKHTKDYAIDLVFESSDAAKAILDGFAPDDPDLRTETALMRIQWERGLSQAERLDRLESAKQLHHLLWAKLSFASWEPAPHVALRHANEALKMAGPPDGNAYGYQRALDLATEKLKLLGRSEEAVSLLRGTLRDPRRAVRADAALRLAEEFHDRRMARAVLAAYAVSSYSEPATLFSAVRQLHGTSYGALYAYVAHTNDKRKSSPESAHWLGLAFLGEGTQAAAYRALKRAADGGLKLAYVNLASLLAGGPSPAAGLDLLGANPGPYEAATNRYPYTVRAELEEAAQEDDNRATALVERGRAHFAGLVAALDEALQSPASLSVSDGQYVSDLGRTFEIAGADSISFLLTARNEGGERKPYFCWRDCPVLGVATIDGSDEGGLIWGGDDGAMKVTWVRDGDRSPVVVEQISPKPDEELRLKALASAAPAVPALGAAHRDGEASH